MNRAARRIVRDLDQWLSSHAATRYPAEAKWLSGPDARHCLENLFHARENWLNSPDPTWWRSGDPHRLLIDTAGPRLTDVHGLSEHGVTILRALFDFLDDTDRFHPASTRTATLHKELTRAAAKYPSAMADESTWRLAKRIFTAIIAEDVDTTDDTAIDAWTAEFSKAPADRRRTVLGDLTDRQPELLIAEFAIRDSQVAAIAPGAPIPEQFRHHHPDRCPDCTSSAYPAISLPTVDELAAAARTSTLLRQLVACGRWADTGRKVTKQANPTPADTRSLAADLGLDTPDSLKNPPDHLLLARRWRLALDLDVLRLHRTVVVPGPALRSAEQALDATADPQQTLDLYQELFDAAVTDPTHPGRSPIPPELDELLRPLAPRALGELYRQNRPTDLHNLIEKLLYDHDLPSADPTLETFVRARTRHGLLAAAEAGAVTVTVPEDAEVDDLQRRSAAALGEPIWAVFPIPDTQIDLTHLGRYIVRENLLAEGLTAPLLEPAH